jgi:hypothetical protein
MTMPAYRGRRIVRVLCGLASLLLYLACEPVVAADQPESLEFPVKASYLYKFAPFVEWPAGTFASPTSPIVLCVVGMDPFGDVLDRAVAGERVGERPIIVRRLRVVDRNSGCHIMYISGSPEQSVGAALQAVERAPVLTITDARHPSSGTGIVHFVIQERRVRFQIDDMAAAQSGIKISSKLLNLAVSVKPRAEDLLRTIACVRCRNSGS